MYTLMDSSKENRCWSGEVKACYCIWTPSCQLVSMLEPWWLGLTAAVIALLDIRAFVQRLQTDEILSVLTEEIPRRLHF